jgi:hypothetical protein
MRHLTSDTAVHMWNNRPSIKNAHMDAAGKIVVKNEKNEEIFSVTSESIESDEIPGINQGAGISKCQCTNCM